MIDFVVAQIQTEKFVVSEEQFSHHHSTVGLDFVQIQVQKLQICALLQSFSQILSTFRLNVIALQVKTKQTRRFRDQVSKCFRAMVSYLIVAQINIGNVNRITL